MSKDFGKLSYQSIPSPRKVRTGLIAYKKCKSCGREYSIPGDVCPYCDEKGFHTVPSNHVGRGMVCPHCNKILLPANKGIDSTKDEIDTLEPADFAEQRASNSNCFYCGEELWQPHVANLSLDGSVKEPIWQRATHYANKTHKGKKSVWVHKEFAHEYFSMVGEEPLNIMDSKTHQGIRKYAPAQYIKNQLKGFFDIAIFDEVQDLKGGFTGQGHAMHALIKASKKQLALTGTIAGGMASHLFYTLYRLDPQRMKEKGFSYMDEMKFSEQYGKVEKQFEYHGDENSVYRASCKGKQVGTPKVKPGISPLIFMDFLLDRTTFLDLSDMSKYLPELKEKVVSVKGEGESEKELLSSYHCVIRALKEAAREKGNGGMALLSKMLQFSLSYLDKPYGVEPILSPTHGGIISEPDNYGNFVNVDVYENLTSKEKKLVDLVRSEQAEGRNVVIYAEYTGSKETCVTYRLQEIIEKHCNLRGQVAVLESSSPKASEREAWMHKKATQGVKVFITNPKCVATGLDFCFTVDGTLYNYPTLIFYQLGYSLFTIWQASRRHYRLIQKEECRTYYMAWQRTTQEAVISLIAEKQSATSAIQGKFSTEGLAAMANGVDERMRLAQALSNMDSINGNDLQDMFDVLAASNGDDGTYDAYKPMPLLNEIIGKEVAPETSFEEFKTGQTNLFDLMSAFAPGAKKAVKTNDESIVATKVVISSVTADDISAEVVRLQLADCKKANKKVVSGQFALF